MNIVISGGSGLIGQHLINNYLKDHNINILTTNKDRVSENASYWSPKEGIIDKALIDDADVIINLAGAPVAKRWTKSYKQKIVESRNFSTKLLIDTCNASSKPKHFISASAIGYYGSSSILKDENCKAGSDFLAKVCLGWEKELESLETLHTHNIIRIGFVLSINGGALVEMLKQFKKGLASPLGDGKQMVSWVHIDDLCRMILFMMESKKDKEIYNAVAPNPVNNKELTDKIAKAFKLPNILPPVPGFVLKLMLGEMSFILLESSNISSQKIEDEGFEFHYSHLAKALESIAL
jgi:hypothetical protein